MLIKNIGKIESYDRYIDIAFRNGSKTRGEKKAKIKKILEGGEDSDEGGRDKRGRRRKVRLTREDKEANKLKKHIFLETERINTINKSLTNILDTILTRFPDFHNLDKIHALYKEIIILNFDIEELKKSMDAMRWAKGALQDLHSKLVPMVKRSRDPDGANNISKSYLGRANSIMKRIDKDLTCLEKFRRFDRWLPAIKTSMFTVCISGFPNVGKSTLLSKITTAKPEIDSYPFTTRRLNLGYIGEDIQVIDTPGTLARFNKMNDIEKLAHLAMRLVGSAIVFLYYPSL